MKLEERIEQSWNFCYDKLFDKTTNLFYDFLTSENGNEYLPTPDEIKANMPNPCGWSSGMEDSALSGGSAMEALIARYELTGDERVKALAKQIFKGLNTLATVSDDKGFLARSVSPFDGKSHFIDSSRDQYTHWIYGAHRYYNSTMPTDEERAQIKQALVWFAEKAERDVVEKNQFFLLREDGGRGVVCRMLGDRLCGHETHRLPMIYMAAWEVSGNQHWLDMYKKYRDWATDFLEEHFDEERTRKWSFPILQMQYSLRLLYDCEQEECYKARYRKLLNGVGEIVERYVQIGMDFLPDYAPEEYWGNWRKELRFLYVFDGVGYVHGTESERNLVNKHMRNFYEAYIIMAMSPDYQVSERLIADFIKVTETVDFAKATGYWPLLTFGAYWVLREKGVDFND